MAFLSQEQLEKIGFKKVGKNVKISDKAAIYNPEDMEIGDHSRIDDFCVISGEIRIGRYVHIAIFCNVAGGSEGIVIEDFAGLAYGCHVFSQSDDYSGRTLTNPTIPQEYKNETKKAVVIGRHSIVGTASLIFPGVNLAEGTAVAAQSAITKSTQEWSIYYGSPAKRLKARKKDLLALEQQFLMSKSNNVSEN